MKKYQTLIILLMLFIVSISFCGSVCAYTVGFPNLKDESVTSTSHNVYNGNIYTSSVNTTINRELFIQKGDKYYTLDGIAGIDLSHYKNVFDGWNTRFRGYGGDLNIDGPRGSSGSFQIDFGSATNTIRRTTMIDGYSGRQLCIFIPDSQSDMTLTIQVTKHILKEGNTFDDSITSIICKIHAY